MMSSGLARWLRMRDVHYGWVVAAATFITMLVAAAAMSAPGVLLAPLRREFGWSTADISSAMATRLVLYGLLGPFAAAFMNRFGLRPVIVTAMALIGIGFAGSLFMTTLWQLLLLWGIVIGVGSGLVAMVLGATVATRWFAQRRGLVMGMMSASTATGQLLFLPLIAAISEHHGWRAAILLVCAMLALAVVAAWLLVRNHPADVGLPLYGQHDISPPPAQRASLWHDMLSPLVALRHAAATPVFWALTASFFICGASTNGLIQTHFISMCGDFGMTSVIAASVLAMMGAFDFVGTIGSGWLSDRFDNRWLLFWYYGLRGISLFMLSRADFTFSGLSVFAVFYGLDWIATVPPTVRLVADHFGREKAGLVFGWVFAGHQLGAAVAAYGAGLSRTLLTSYMPAFMVSGALCIMAALLVLSMPKARKLAV